MRNLNFLYENRNSLYQRSIITQDYTFFAMSISENLAQNYLFLEAHSLALYSWDFSIFCTNKNTCSSTRFKGSSFVRNIPESGFKMLNSFDCTLNPFSTIYCFRRNPKNLYAGTDLVLLFCMIYVVQKNTVFERKMSTSIYTYTDFELEIYGRLHRG